MNNRISSRVSKIKPSATMSLNAKTKMLLKSGKNIINMSVGEPDLEPPLAASFSGIKAIVNGQTGYTPAAGIQELRESISDYLWDQNKVRFHPNQIVTSAGGKQPLYNVFQVICDYGDEVILPSPFWVSYPEQISLAGAKPIIVRCNSTANFKLSHKQLIESITEKTKAVIINSPNNPTGSVYTESELLEIGNILKNHPNIFIISDEIYDKFVYEGKHVSISSLFPELLDRIIITNGFSKVFAMTGWRLGYIVAPLDVAEALTSFQSHATGSPSTISQYAGISALKNFNESTVQEFKEKRDLLVNGLNKIPGINCIKPDGGFYIFPDVSSYFGARFENKIISDVSTFSNLLLDNQLISVVSGDAFGEPTNIRLNFTLSKDIILEAIKRINNFTSQLQIVSKV
ncbi:pyridoxal phosphate-dependent aminotransferase [Abyssisolibacter fermentans]|uniref:pyridoxal phosphate-dependent aminotransferase n=1 Tax=Abyssisolibacter fermentans TaxID=1766203 RepID=UPI000835BA54|nr:pyridoxal phosphate-dependent aminotransferase [Abyssisolibacter fermentans]